jgi:hypothetical protein
MRKSIKTYDELLVSLASKGDPIAFFNLSLSYFRNQYNSLRQEGKNDTEARKKILSIASEMYKKVLHSKQIDIQTLLQSETAESGSESAEFHLESVSFDRECSSVMNALNRHLQKLSSRHSIKKLSDKSRLFANPVVKPIVLTVTVILLLAGLYAGMHISGTYFKFSLYHKEKGVSFSFPIQSKDSTNRIEIPVNQVKTVEKIDSVKTVTAQALDSVQTPPEKPVKTVKRKKPVFSNTDPSLLNPQTTQNALSGTITEPSQSQPVKNDPQVIQKSETRIPSVPVNPQMP